MDRRSLVLSCSAGHLGDGRGCGTAPRSQVRADTVEGEQLPVVDQVDDGLGSGPPRRRAELADHDIVLVANVTSVGQVCLATLPVDVGEAGQALPGEPVQESGQLSESPEGGSQV